MKKGVLRNFVKVTGKFTPVPGLFFNKVSALRPAILLKKETLTQVLSCEFCKISKNTFFREHLWTTASVVTQTKELFIKHMQHVKCLHQAG